MRHRIARAVVLLLVLPGTTWAERLPSRTFTTADGLAHNVVNRIVRDALGYQWFCTREGLSRFDGTTFVTYGLEDGLPSAVINDFLQTRRGDYWVATSRGLVRFDPGGARGRGEGRRMFTLVPGDSRTPLDVTVLLEDRREQLLVGTLAGLHRVSPGDDGEQAMTPALDGAREVLSLVETGTNELWVGTSTGLLLVIDGKLRARFTNDDGLQGNFVSALLADGDAGVWAGTRDGGLARVAWDGRQNRIAVERVPLESRSGGTARVGSWINYLLRADDGTIWVATGAAVVRIRPGAPSPTTTPRHDPEIVSGIGAALAFGEDSNHNVWVATQTGARRLIVRGFTVYSAEDGIIAASSPMQTPTGAIVTMTAGTTADGAAWFDGSRFVPLRLPVPAADTSWGWNQMMLVDRDGDWWIGTRSGVVRLRRPLGLAGVSDAKVVGRYSSAPGSASVTIRLFEDSRGDIWISTVGEGRAHGLARWERATGRMHRYGPEHGLLDPQRYFVSAFAEDAAGAVWMGFSSDGGLVRFRDGRFGAVSLEAMQPIGTVRNLAIGSDDTLWGATSRGGLVRIRSISARPVASRLTARDGLGSNDVNAVVEAPGGSIYAATARGIDRVDPASGRILRQGTAEELLIGEVYGAIRDRDGALWFGCHSGMLRLIPTADRDRPPLSIVIDRLMVNGREQPVSAVGQADLDAFELPAGRVTLHVGFLAPGPAATDRVRYQFRLDGVDQDWGALSDQRSVAYASIGPGQYKFAVRAVGADGRISGNTAGFAFVVLAPVWQRPWFLAMAFATLAAGAYIAHRLRLTRLLHVAEIRTRIARDLHDDIGANLTRIAVLAEVVRQQGNGAGADTRLASIATVARESMTAMNEIVWAISPDRDRLEDLAQRMREHAEDVFDQEGIRVSLSFPEPLKDMRIDLAVRRTLYLIFKEATTNAARHSRCSTVRVDISRRGGCMRLSVRDDGIGFDDSSIASSGIDNMRRRAALVGGTAVITSSPGRGTAVDVEIPLARGLPTPMGR